MKKPELFLEDHKAVKYNSVLNVDNDKIVPQLPFVQQHKTFPLVCRHLSHTATIVYSQLIDYFMTSLINRRFFAFPTIVQMAQKNDYTYGAVYKAVVELNAKKRIIVFRVNRKFGKTPGYLYFLPHCIAKESIRYAAQILSFHFPETTQEDYVTIITECRYDYDKKLEENEAIDESMGEDLEVAS